jgi:UPF0716 protein FxsA
VGLSLLVPAVRKAAFVWAKSNIKVHSFSMGVQGQTQPRPQSGDRVIDGDFEDVTTQKKNPNDPPSEWTRH